MYFFQVINTGTNTFMTRTESTERFVCLKNFSYDTCCFNLISKECLFNKCYPFKGKLKQQGSVDRTVEKKKIPVI